MNKRQFCGICVQAVGRLSQREILMCCGPKKTEELFQRMCPAISFNWHESVPSWNIDISSFHNKPMTQPRFLSPRIVHVPNTDNLSGDQVSGDSPAGYTLRWLKEFGATTDRK